MKQRMIEIKISLPRAAPRHLIKKGLGADIVVGEGFVANDGLLMPQMAIMTNLSSWSPIPGRVAESEMSSIDPLLKVSLLIKGFVKKSFNNGPVE